MGASSRRWKRYTTSTSETYTTSASPSNQSRWGFYFDFEHFHKKEVDERKSNEKRAKDLKAVRKSNEKRGKDLATLLPTQDKNLRSRGAKPTHKGGGPIKQPGGGFRGN
jgi:hypothetical protein